MTYRQVFDAEKRNTIQDLFEIRFYQEGLWWKAWEWSVYLYDNIFINLLPTSKKILNILKRRTVQNKEGSIIVIGFPIEAFNNFLPNINEFEIKNDKEIVYDLSKNYDIKDLINSLNIILDNYDEIFQKWKYDLPFTEMSMERKEEIFQLRKQKIEEGKEKALELFKDNLIYNNESKAISPIITNSIFEKIIKYSIENKTLLENTKFLIDIKQEILNLKYL